MRPSVVVGALVGVAGLGLAVAARASTSKPPPPVLPVANGVDKTRHLSDDFFRAVDQMASDFRSKGAGITGEDILNAFMGESGVQNGKVTENPYSHCAGLNGMCPLNFSAIGFLPSDVVWKKTNRSDTRRELTDSERREYLDKWEALPVDEQFPYVRRYFEIHAKAKGYPAFRNVGDLYLVNFAPAFLGSSDETVIFRPPSNEYNWNQVIDQDPTKGFIQVADMARYMERAKWNRGPYSTKTDKPGTYWAELLFRLKRVREPSVSTSGVAMTSSAAAPGPLLLLGDSITVGYAPFVKADGGVKRVAEVGQTSTWLLGQVKGMGARGDLDGTKTAVVLTGTNDVGGLATPDKILSNIVGVRSELESRGVDVYLATLPPFKGWWNYARYFADTERKRKTVNDDLRQATLPGRLIHLDALLADPSDPERLSSYFDSGDHLHPRGDRLGPLIQAQLVAGPTPMTAQEPTSSSAGPLLAGAGLAALAWWFARKL